MKEYKKALSHLGKAYGHLERALRLLKTNERTEFIAILDFCVKHVDWIGGQLRMMLDKEENV